MPQRHLLNENKSEMTSLGQNLPEPLPQGSCSVKTELNHALLFHAAWTSRAWQGAAAGMDGRLGDSAFQERKPWGTQQARRSSSRALEGTRFCHQLGSAGALPGQGRVAFRVSWRRSSCRAPWRPQAVAAAAGEGTARSSAPRLAARSRHGKLLRANVAGTMESPGLPSAEILGCVSYAHRHGSSENPVSTRLLHITVFFQQLLYFGTEGGEGGEESWREWQEGMSQDPTYDFFFFFFACPKMHVYSHPLYCVPPNFHLTN